MGYFLFDAFHSRIFPEMTRSNQFPQPRRCERIVLIIVVHFRIFPLHRVQRGAPRWTSEQLTRPASTQQSAAPDRVHEYGRLASRNGFAWATISGGSGLLGRWLID